MIGIINNVVLFSGNPALQSITIDELEKCAAEIKIMASADKNCKKDE